MRLSKAAIRNVGAVAATAVVAAASFASVASAGTYKLDPTRFMSSSMSGARIGGYNVLQTDTIQTFVSLRGAAYICVTLKTSDKNFQWHFGVFDWNNPGDVRDTNEHKSYYNFKGPGTQCTPGTGWYAGVIKGHTYALDVEGQSKMASHASFSATLDRNVPDPAG